MPVPVVIISGFLGAGKTSLLNFVLSDEHGLKIGVLVNDFGAINIDAKLVVGVDENTVSLANGCVCCTIRDDLSKACQDIMKRSDPPEFLIIECSGVSDPGAVIRTFDSPELLPLFRIDNLISVVDAEQFPKLLTGELADLARAQVQAADMVVLNKVDLIGQAALEELKAQMKEIVPRARMLEAHQGRVPLELVMGAHNAERGSRPSEPPSHGHGHSFATWHWKSDQPLSLPKLRAVIEELPDSVYRAKGIVYIEELPGYQVVFQMVGKRYNFRESEFWKEQSPGSEIVLIATEGLLDPEDLQRAFDACIGGGDLSESPMLRLSRRLALSVDPK